MSKRIVPERRCKSIYKKTKFDDSTSDCASTCTDDYSSTCADDHSSIHTDDYTDDYTDTCADSYISLMSSDISDEPADTVSASDLVRELARIRVQMRLPTMRDILVANIPDKDKCHAISVYEIACHETDYTFAQYEAYQQVRRIINMAVLTREELDNIHADEVRLCVAKVPADIAIKKKIYGLNASDATKGTLYGMCNDMMRLPRDSAEYTTTRSKLLWAVSLPHNNLAAAPDVDLSDTTQVKTHCVEVLNRLNETLHGLAAVKEKLIQTYLNRLYNPHARSMLGLCSAPGLGKTAIASAMADAVGLPFERISLGGMCDSSIFKGSDSVWVGSKPNIILCILRRMTVCNGVVLFDEIDKLGTTPQGKEIQYALLHITDYTQNKEFQDLFLSEFHHDLSNIWFIFGMNTAEWLDPALADRLDITRLDSYSSAESDYIIKHHFLPEAVANAGMPPGIVTIGDKACDRLRRALPSGDGLRPVQRAISDLVSKINMFNVWGDGAGDLSYNIPGFTGFPYEITAQTINAVFKAKGTPSYNMMYS